MTEEVVKEDSGESAIAAQDRSILDKVANEIRLLFAAKATGELAALRRIALDRTPPAAFFRVIANVGFTEMRPERLKAWAGAVHIMAQRPDSLRPGSLGASFANIDSRGQRIDMLLNARGVTLLALARRIALRLAGSAEPMPYRDLCQLVIWDGQPDREPDAEKLRIRIAQSYHIARRKQQPDAASSRD